MSIFSKWFSGNPDHKIEAEHLDKREQTIRKLEKERKEFHETVARIDAGARLMSQWASANQMVGKRHD